MTDKANDVFVETSGDWLRITIPGFDALGIDDTRMHSWLQDRLACGNANECFSPDQTLAERVVCVKQLSDRRLLNISHTPAPAARASLLREPLTIERGEDGLHINISRQIGGPALERLSANLVSRRLQEVLECKRSNRCGAGDQTRVELWRCVARLGERRFRSSAES